MSVRLRLTRMGRRNRPYYRIAAFDNRCRRDGRALEFLGTYDPLVKDEKNFDLNEDRIRHWLSQGATPSESVASMILKCGIELPARRGSGVRKMAKKD